jgi:hypothetical protein
MKTETSQRRRTLLWALPASLVLHALIAALLVYGLPIPPQEPQEEQPINVALVPPPEPPKPKPPAPPPPKPEAKSQPEPKVEKPTPEKLPPVNVLKPVFQFGDKDTGPRKSMDGGSDQDQAPSPAKDNEPEPAAAPKDAESKPALAPDVEEPAQSTKIGEKSEADKQEAGAPDADKQESATTTPLPAAENDSEIELPASAEAPQARPDNVPKPRPVKAAKSEPGNAGVRGSTAAATSLAYSGLPGVRKLFSQGATGDVFAMSSMADVPRDQRIAQLCASVLSQELRDAAYAPHLIPSIPLKSGNILDAPDTAFRTATTWYHLRFRCGIDANATRVTSFAFRVGAVASPEESVLLDRDARRQGFR